MDTPAFELRTEPDETVGAVRLQQVLVHTVRKIRPFRLVLDLAAFSRLDAIDAATVSAACGMATTTTSPCTSTTPPAASPTS